MKRILVILLGLIFVTGAAVADDVDVIVNCVTTEIPAEGGDLTFDVTLQNNLGYSHAGEIWLMVEGQGCTSGPYCLQCFWLNPSGNVFTDCVVPMPAYLLPGEFMLHVYVGGYYLNYIAGMGTDTFTKLPAQ
ncbi:hypothetical protein KQI52_14395 [bacterium]|nr:hypothetical protein [bacterium]